MAPFSPQTFDDHVPPSPFAMVSDMPLYMTEAAPQGDSHLLSHLHEIIAQRSLTALFQPIIRMRSGEIIGYEGLIRGPSNSPLHSPLNLFKVARANKLSVQVEHLCRHIVMAQFAQSGLPGN
eukprot:gene34548-40503_t